MTQQPTRGDSGDTWIVVPQSAADLAHEEAFAREAVAYLRANGLPLEEIERALCQEFGLGEAQAHEFALAR